MRWFGIDVGEKRTWWKRLVVKGTTSHGSVPLGDNPVERLVRALNRIVAYETPVRLTPAVDRFFKAQARDQTGPGEDAGSPTPRAALKTRRGRAWLLSEPERNALLRNTITPTVLRGIGEDQHHSRRRPRSSSTSGCCPTRTPSRSGGRWSGSSPIPRSRSRRSATWRRRYDAPLDTEMFRALERVAGRLLPGVPVATPMSAGASDRPYWAAAGPICYGIDPWLVELEESRHSVHGNDERLSLENIEFGLRFYVETLLEMAGR